MPLVINSLWAWARGLGVSPHHGIVSSAYGVYRLNSGYKNHSRFFHELVRSTPFQWELQVRSKGIWISRLQLTDEAFLGAPFPLPPLPEQTAIVRFLDWVERRIRRVIRARRRRIKLLEEYKQALIHRAVTGQIDIRTGQPYPAYKASGIEWLGEVPAHWEVRRLKTLISTTTSGSRGWSNFAADHGPLFLRIGNLTRDWIGLDLSDAVRLSLPAQARAEAERTRVRPGDLLLSITAYIGSVAVVPDDIEEAYMSQHVACCRPVSGAANVRWIAFVLLSPVGQTHGTLCMYGGTKQGLALDDVRNYTVVLPPREEQDSAVAWIESHARATDDAISADRREIELLREFRTRLIADVVTGKFDVREAAERLPAAPAEEDAEPLDEETMAEGEEPLGDEGAEALEEVEAAP